MLRDNEFSKVTVLPEGEDAIYPKSKEKAKRHSSGESKQALAKPPEASAQRAPPVEQGSQERSLATVLDAIPPTYEVRHRSEVFLAQHLARLLRHALDGHVVHAEGTFWGWNGTVWSELPKREMRLAVHKFDGAAVGTSTSPLSISGRTIDGILKETATILSEASFFSESTVGLSCLNGVVRIAADGTTKVDQHDPADRFRYTVPAKFEEGGITPPRTSLLYRLLDGAFKGDEDSEQKIALVGEMLGAAAFGMATRLAQPKALILLGESASNGKSTIAGLLSTLLPQGAVSAIPPSAYEDEKRIIQLAGKAANVADELSASAIGGETLKASVTGNAIQGRDVYRSVVTF